MKSQRVAGTAVVAATMAALTGLAVQVTAGGPAGEVAMREIVHIQATPTPAGYVPAHDGTTINEN